MIRIAIAFMLSLFILPLKSTCQPGNIEEELKFAFHLSGAGEKKEALFITRNLLNYASAANRSRADSINYISGWVHFTLKSLDSASTYLARVSPETPFYPKAVFYSAYSLLYNSNTDSSLALLARADLKSDSGLIKLMNLQRAGTSLLTGNYSLFDSLALNFGGDYYPIVNEEQSLLRQKELLYNFKQKSPLKAALMSAIIPGSGKWYAGYPGQAISAFVPVVALGAVAVESLIKGGPASAQFIGLGAAFSVFYVGNIWGSALAARVKDRYRKNEIRKNILVDLHSPLGRVFE